MSSFRTTTTTNSWITNSSLATLKPSPSISSKIKVRLILFGFFCLLIAPALIDDGLRSVQRTLFPSRVRRLVQETPPQLALCVLRRSEGGKLLSISINSHQLRR